MDYEIHRAARHCAATGRELAEGETFYSVLVAQGATCQRFDYSAEAWQGPPTEQVLGWWQAKMPTRESKRARLAPNDVLLEYFQELTQQPGEEDAQYVLALLLVRRRILRLEDTESDARGQNVLVLFCPRDEGTYRVTERTLDEARTDDIQARLSQLLFANAG